MTEIPRRDAIIAGAGAGLGGLMAARPDQQYYPAAGGAQIPGSRTGKIRASQVIITGNGPNAGLFVYAVPPALGLGNPPVFSVVAPGVTHDPFGNAVAAVLEAGTIGTNFMQVDQFGNLILYSGGSVVWVFNPTKQAMFIYSPAAGLGNLVQSISPVSGTDAFGNAYLPGQVNYKKITSADFQAYQTNSGGWNLWTAAAAGGPWNLVFSTGLQVDEIGYSLASNVNSAQVVIGETAAALEITPSNAAILVTSGLSTFQGQVLINLARAGGLLFQVTNTATPTSNALSAFNVAAAGDAWMRFRMGAETANRIGFDWTGGAGNAPRLHFGSGAAPPDTTIYRAAPNLFGSDYIAFDAGGGQAESWNAVTFANGWGNSLSGAGMQYKRVAAPDRAVWYVGRILAPAGIVSGQPIITAVPTAYRPISIGRILAANTTTGALVQLQAELNGTITYRSGAVAGDNIDLTSAGNLVSLDA